MPHSLQCPLISFAVCYIRWSPAVSLPATPPTPVNLLTFCYLFADWILSIRLQTSDHKPILVALCHWEEKGLSYWGHWGQLVLLLPPSELC